MAKIDLEKTIMSSMEEAFWFYDHSDSSLIVSPGWRKLFNIAESGKVELSLFSGFHGKGGVTLKQIIEEYSESRNHHTHIFVIPQKNGEHCWIEDVAFKIELSAAHTVHGVFGHCRDITKIHQRRHRNDLIDHMGKDLDICLWEISLSAKTMHLDFPGVNTMSRIISLDEQIKLLHPDDRPKFIDALELAEHGKNDFFFEGRVMALPASDKWKWIRAIGSVHGESNNKEISGFSYVINQERENDFKIAALNQELNRSKLEIQRAFKEQQQFVKDVTTEMRAPLDMIISGIQLLEDKELCKEFSSVFNSLKGAGFGILKMVQGLSEIVKLQTLEYGTGNDRFDMKKLVVNTTELVNLGLNLSDSTSFSFEFSSQPPLMVFGHLERTKKLLTHLVAMLLEEAKSGLIYVKLTMQKEGKTDLMELSYRFTHNGNDDRSFNVQQFFEDYLAKGSISTLEGKSFDFGMTVLRKYAELAGASLSVMQIQHEETFKLLFPYRPDLANQEFQSSDKLLILVVDDIELNRELMGMYLEELDCEVLEAENGVEAVALFQKYQFDLILMDLQMPQMSGYDAVILMRQIEESASRHRANIVAISAYEIADEVEKCIQLGFDNAMDKPVPKEKIVELANELISKKKSIA